MIFHIIKKDWKLLWRVVLLVAATQFALAVMLFHIDHAAVDKNPYGLLLQLVLFMTFLGRAVLIVMCVQQDPIPGDRQDWLTRPVKRFDLMFAKLAFVLLFAQGPVLIADFVQAFAGGASFRHSLSAAITRSLFLLPIFTLPFLAFGALTRNLTEAIAGAVIFFLLLSGGEMLFVGLSEGRRILQVSPTTLTGLDWMTDALQLLVAFAAVSAILALQYLGRKTAISRAVLAAAAVVCFAVRLLPWNIAYAMQQQLTAARGSGQQITVAFAPGQTPYKNLSEVNPDILQGQFGGTRNADTIVYIPLTVQGLPAQTLLKNDRAEVTMTTSDGKTFNLGVGGDFAPLPQAGVAIDIYSALYVPDDLYQRYKSEQVRLDVTYFSTLMRLADQGAMAALGGHRDFASLGQCTSRMNPGETQIDIRCLQPGTIPLCTNAMLSDPASGVANFPKISCIPNYAPVYPMLIPDGMSRYEAELPFRDSNSLSNYPIQGKD
ncbi:MAG TPA: hypothetical protein VIJ53_16155, partial [Acidobacteriaceae bacterium]